MNRRTRIALLVLLGIVVALLALGALPGLLKTGDPYYVTATVEGEWTGNDSEPLPDAGTALPVEQLSEQRYPYSMAAIADSKAGTPGRSDPYWKGPFGLKETFTHSPFDELDAIRSGLDFPENPPGAAEGGNVYVHDNETIYRLTITQDD